MPSQMIYVFLWFTILFREKFSLHPQTITKSDFQPSPIKSDNKDHPTVATGHVWPFGWFCIISKKNKKI
jgi:hypothetical protein